MFALAAYRDGLCPLHGGPLEECTSHEETGPAFVAERIRCRAHDAKLMAMAALTKTQRPGALLWTVKKQER